MSSCLELYSSATGLERLSPAWKAAPCGVRCHWILVSCRRSLSCARNHLTDPGPRFGMLANASSVVSRISPIVFSPANFTAFRIRVGNRTISTKVSSGRSGPRSSIRRLTHLALTFSPSSTSRRVAIVSRSACHVHDFQPLQPRTRPFPSTCFDSTKCLR